MNTNMVAFCIAVQQGPDLQESIVFFEHREKRNAPPSGAWSGALSARAPLQPLPLELSNMIAVVCCFVL